MVCGAERVPTQDADLATYSPHTGENQLDTPMSMHSYRPRCASASLFTSGRGPEMSTFHLLPESCLLHWIQSSQETQTRVEKALKCPQCGADYEIESDNPPALRLLNKLNKILTGTGKLATVVGMGTTVITFGTCAFVYPKFDPTFVHTNGLRYWKRRYLLDVHVVWSLGSPRVFGAGNVSS